MENRLESIFARSGKSDAGLAEAVGVQTDTVRAIREGRYVPSLELSRRLADALDVSLDELFPPKEAFVPEQPQLRRVILPAVVLAAGIALCILSYTEFMPAFWRFSCPAGALMGSGGVQLYRQIHRYRHPEDCSSMPDERGAYLEGRSGSIVTLTAMIVLLVVYLVAQSEVLALTPGLLLGLDCLIIAVWLIGIAWYSHKH